MTTTDKLAAALKACMPHLDAFVWGAADLNAEAYARADETRTLARTALAEYEAARVTCSDNDKVVAAITKPWTMIHGWHDDFNGTSLQGEMDVNYADIVKVFGKETSKGDDYKVQAEWLIRFADGTVATIYDYKMGKKYNGRDGISKTKVRDWHIGGRNKDAVRNVLAAMFPTTQPEKQG